jgi:hypothetical protein
VVFAGAGLSIPEPSRLPSARALASECAALHTARTLEVLAPQLHGDLEALARHFHAQGRLKSYFLPVLINWPRFFGTPNRGHEALADFLFAGVVDAVITTNVDVLIEHAARNSGALDVWAATDGDQAAIPRRHQPLLKLHGCCTIDRLETLWCREQLEEINWQARTSASNRWLAGRLTQRDLVFIGYWTDWAYLNDALVSSITLGTPRSVTLIDLSTGQELEQKAPLLWQWAQREGVIFRHEQSSGDECLDELRKAYSAVTLGIIARAGTARYERRAGTCAPPLPNFLALSSDDLYDLRRDWSGASRTEPVTREYGLPPQDSFGQFVLSLIARGATLESSVFSIHGMTLRVKNAAGRLLHALRTEAAMEIFIDNAPAVTVCVGADDDGGVPSDILRGDEASTIIRPSAEGDWCTQAQLNTLMNWR